MSVEPMLEGGLCQSDFISPLRTLGSDVPRPTIEFVGLLVHGCGGCPCIVTRWRWEIHGGFTLLSQRSGMRPSMISW